MLSPCPATVMLMLMLVVVPCVAQVAASSAEADRVFMSRRIVDPLLPIVFFDSASSTIPARYHLYPSSDETREFVDTLVPGARLLDRYYWILDVVGYRLRMKHKARLTILGVEGYGQEMNRMISLMRAEAVRDYLIRVWNIEPERITTDAPRGPWWENLDRARIGELRSVYLFFDDVDVIKPIVRWTTAGTSGEPFASDTSKDVVIPMVMFRFDSPEPGAFNLAVMRDLVFRDAMRAHQVSVDGYCEARRYTDGAERLAKSRAEETARIISSKLPKRARRKVTARGHEHSDSLFTNHLPEGRYFNQAVVVRMRMSKR